MDRNAIRQAWDEVSATYAERRNPEGSDADLLATLRDQLGPDPTVLDIGCGDGARTLANLPEDSIGLDISRHGLELAGETVPESRLLQASMERVPLAANSVDAVTAYHAVFHVPRAEHPGVYEELSRVLRPGGHLLMTLPKGRFETVRRDWMGGQMFFSTPGRDTTLSQLRDAGFGTLRTETVSDPLGSNAEFVFAERTQTE